MSEVPFALHAHTYSVTIETYKGKKNIHEEMFITQEGQLDNQKFINSMEGKKYPLFLIMYHPEYQLLEFIGKQKWKLAKNRKMAEEIAYRISLFLNKQARLNNNKIEGEENLFFDKWNITSNGPRPY